MERLILVFKTRPLLNLSIYALILGLMLLPLNSSAKNLDENLRLESWMTTPFEVEYVESELILEDWMITPFENDFAESEIELEDWMTSNWL